MAITNGFTTSLSDEVTVNEYFLNTQTGGSGTVSTSQTNSTQPVVSTYILVSNAGNIIYENQLGELQYVKLAPEGLFPLSATKILSSGNVRGTVRSTTAIISTWFADYKY